MTQLQLADIEAAAARLKGQVHQTPILSSSFLNHALGHRIWFKAENLQKIGAFKARGAYNTLAWLKQNNKLPQSIVGYSSGNHAQAVAWAAAQFNVKATILMPKEVSKIKAQATEAYGAQVVLCEDRATAESRAEEYTKQGAYLIPPYDHDQVICGQGTAVLEALNEQSGIDAVFAPCGGGGLMSGTVITAKGLNPEIKVYGAEPLKANDAAQSLKQGRIVKLPQSPDTLADGVRTLAVSERTFQYLKQLDGIFEIDEQSIVYWTQWLTHLLKVTIEPTAALSMAAACQWLKGQETSRDVLLVLSGGNMDLNTRQQIWQQDYLSQEPAL